jgi:zinc D-Ala-D-Ala carboxypeptidase
VSPRSIGEDIPVARRTQAPGPKRPSLAGRTLRLLIGSALVAGALAWLFSGPLRHVLEAPPVEGLNARLSADGRLLGHFPYPEVPESKLVAVMPGIRLRPDAGAALLTMQRAAAADGIELAVLSAHRSVALQKQLFFEVKSERNQSSRERARVSAPPGFSEHSTGYAVDLGDATLPHTHLSASFDTTPAFGWLKRNAARYHFQLSFPRGNAQGVSYEPWHWRFEGSTEALRLFEPAQRLVAGSVPGP